MVIAHVAKLGLKNTIAMYPKCIKIYTKCVATQLNSKQTISKIRKIL